MAARSPVFRGPAQPIPCNFDFKQAGKDWGHSFPMCKDGCKQSPINLPGAHPVESRTLDVRLRNYKDVPYPAFVQKSYGWLGVELKSGEMEVTFPGGGEDTYVPINFHFHAPSDHTMFDKHFDLEMHIVHVRKSTKQLGAVLSIFFDHKAGGNTTNNFIASLSPDLVNDEASFVVVDETYHTGYYQTEQHIELQELIESLDFSELVHYEGSLTTPPCTEGIKWFVLKQPQPIAKH
jgi:carbonic anhydrase